MKITELQEAGATVSGTQPTTDLYLHGWTDASGEVLDETSHATCPGHTAWVGYDWQNNLAVIWFCADPTGNGHRNRYSARPATAGGKTEEQAAAETAERRRVREGNIQWRAATTVRRTWLKDVLLARKTPPPGGTLVVFTALAGCEHWLRHGMETGHEFARGLLSIPEATGSHGGVYGHGEVAAAITKASPKRAELIAVGIVVGAWEDALDDMAWRRGPGDYPDPRTYLAHLARWGYEPSGIEQAVIDGQPWGADRDWSK